MAGLPSLLSPYWITLLFTLLINIGLTCGINLLWGYAGYLNLGYMTFFGLGAYGTGILFLKGTPFLASLLLCLLIMVPAAALLAFPLFRLQGHFFSVATLGVLILLEETVGKFPLFSGGLEGLSLPLGDYGRESYWLSLALAVGALGTYWLLNQKRLGFQLRMIKEDERMAQSVGVPVFSRKIQAYLLGVVIALLAGGITLRQTGYIGPASAFGLSVSMPPIIMALISGGKKRWGPVWGALVVTGLQELLWTGLDRWVLSGYGMVLILIGLLWTGFRSGSQGQGKWFSLPGRFSKFF